MSKKNKLTPNQDKYKELRRRLKRRLSDLKKRGMTPNKAFSEEWVSTEFPENLNKRLLKKMQQALDNIYKYVRYYDPLKEVYISGEERRKQERSEAVRKAWETRRENARRTDQYWEDYENNFGYSTDEEYLNGLLEEALQAIQVVEEMLDDWSPNTGWTNELQALKQEDHDTVLNIFNGARNALGDDVVARNIIDNQAELLPLLNEVLYDSGDKYKLFSGSGREGMRKAIGRIMYILYGRPLTVEESIRLTEISEGINESE